MQPPLDYFTYQHPRKSSDYPLVFMPPERPERFFMVADMVGRPRGLRWRHYMRTMERQLLREWMKSPVDSEESFHARVVKTLQWHSDFIHRIRASHDSSAFGFCVCAAAFWESRGRIYSLGDCRAYHFRKASDVAPAQVACLTEDQNKLHDALAAGASSPSQLTEQTMSDLSHQLGGFLGIDLPQAVADRLANPRMVELGENECLLLATDGFHMPHVRALAGHAQMKLTLSEFYLERWLSSHLEESARHIPEQRALFWPEFGEWLLEETHRTRAHRERYRDDIAMIGVYR